MASSTLAQQAADLDWGLDAGMNTVADAVTWADQLLADPAVPYSDELFAVSTGGKLSVVEMRSLLGRLERPDDYWPAIRRFIGRMADALAADPEKAYGFAVFFELSANKAGDNPASVYPALRAAYDYIYEEDLAQGHWEVTREELDMREAREKFLKVLKRAAAHNGSPTEDEIYEKILVSAESAKEARPLGFTIMTPNVPGWDAFQKTFKRANRNDKPLFGLTRDEGNAKNARMLKGLSWVFVAVGVFLCFVPGFKQWEDALVPLVPLVGFIGFRLWAKHEGRKTLALLFEREHLHFRRKAFGWPAKKRTFKRNDINGAEKVELVYGMFDFGSLACHVNLLFVRKRPFRLIDPPERDIKGADWLISIINEWLACLP